MVGKEKYITLKEAASISGYASDYIGQLIRKGKLPGKQVYHNVAWMTTEEAVRLYMKKNLNGKPNAAPAEKIIEQSRRIKNWLFSQLAPEQVLKTCLYFVIVISLGFLFVLFYVFSVNIDKKLEQRAMEKLKNSAAIWEGK